MTKTSIMALLAATLLSVPAATAQKAMLEKFLTDEPGRQGIAIVYPQIGVKPVDTAIAAWVRSEAAKFSRYVNTDRPPGRGPRWTLNITCRIARNDRAMFAAVCPGAMNDDGNHTHFTFTTFNYALPAARRLAISDVVTARAFAKMRAYAVAHMISEDPDFGAEVADGALAPKAETFAAFTLSPTAITVYFTPEQLGNMTSAGGHAVIPLSELKGLLLAPQ